MIIPVLCISIHPNLYIVSNITLPFVSVLQFVVAFSYVAWKQLIFELHIKAHSSRERALTFVISVILGTLLFVSEIYKLGFTLALEIYQHKLMNQNNFKDAFLYLHIFKNTTSNFKNTAFNLNV